MKPCSLSEIWEGATFEVSKTSTSNNVKGIKPPNLV